MNDITPFVTPISDERPAGVNLRDRESTHSDYQDIRLRRAEARRAERRIEQGESAAQPTEIWRDVRKLAESILQYQSRDFEVLAYLIESMVRLESFGGLATGLEILVQLVDSYWDHLYPLPGEVDAGQRIAFIVGLNGAEKNGTLVAPILQCPIVRSVDSDYSSAQYLVAGRLGKLSKDQLSERANNGQLVPAVIQAAADTTDPAFVRDQREAIQRGLRLIQRLAGLVDERCEPGALHVSRIRDALQTCLQSMTYLYGREPDPQPEEITPEEGKDKTVVEGLLEPEGERTVQKTPNPIAVSPASVDQIRTREEALEILGHLAKWFRLHEPHSPLSYALEQLARRGRMALPELLEHLIPNTEAREVFLSLSAIQSPLDMADELNS
ncbi:MAG: type VI secretion system protein TssA [Planctomycetales bacterium]